LGSGRCGFRDWVQVGGRGAGSRGGVEDEVAEQFARGGGVDDADVAVGDEHDDAGLGVFAAEADVVEAAVVAEGDASGLVDLVVADAPVGVVGAAAGMGWVRAAVSLVRPPGWAGFGRLFSWVVPRRRSSASKALRPPRPPARRVVKTMPLSVRVEAGSPCWAAAARNVARTIGPVTR
jgi:hypothetical protein